MEAHGAADLPAAAAPAGAAAPGSKPAPIDLSKYTSAGELLAQAGADSVKVELSRLGLKCGGTPQMRAERLWSTKGAQPHSFRRCVAANTTPRWQASN